MGDAEKKTEIWLTGSDVLQMAWIATQESGLFC